MVLLPRIVRVLLVVLYLGTVVAWASITGSVSGVIMDPSGAVIPAVGVVITNTQTGIKTEARTDEAGFYNFSALSIGVYEIEIRKAGFKTFRQSGLVVDANSALRVDANLDLGTATEEVTVKSDVLRVETTSTQMGEVIEGSKLVTVPLNGRAFTDLLALQPGVVPSAYGAQATGLNDRPVDGGLNAGNQSVNGGREASNGFMVNGATVEEGKNNGTAIIPDLDSIQEFRIITNNFDAEYGNFSGGQVNVATKSGTNLYHGSAFDFLRNTVFNSRNFYDTSVGKFIQNQFGGTFGGPIRKDKAFFFVDYQGTRKIQGPTATAILPSLADRTGDLSDGVAGTLTGTVSGDDPNVNPNAWANVLSKRLGGQPVALGEPYFFSGCNTTNPASKTGCVFPAGPNGGPVIPRSAWSPAAIGLLPFIPQPNLSGNPVINFSNSAFEERLGDNKGAIRLDGNTRFGMISGYYFMDDYLVDQPYPGGTTSLPAMNGANVPGFNSVTPGRAQLFVLDDTKSFGPSALNEFRFSYLRNASTFNIPKGGLGVTLASLGFTTGFTAPGGIGPIQPSLEGVPLLQFNNFTIGVPATTTGQFNNTFQWQDNFSKIIGTHTLKFGGQFHYDQINERNLTLENGQFVFNGLETGSDFADFLLGAPASFGQASKQVLDSRTKYMGLYIEDSWRAKPSLTLNYGLRWEFSQPWYDTQNKIETIVPGLQSVLFPGAPLGWVVPGDPGIPRTLAPTKYDAFSPRLGLAWSPNTSSELLTKITGGPGKTSIRVGFGVYFTSVEDLTQFLEVGDAPYGLFYGSPNPPLLESPYIDRGSGFNEGQRFPFAYPPSNVSASNPDNSFNWAAVEPIFSGFVFWHQNRMPYAEHYEFSLQRQFGTATVLGVSYVGTQGHKLITSLEANAGSPSLCQALNALGATPSCGPFGENPSPPGFMLPAGVTSVPGAPASLVAPCSPPNPTPLCVSTTRTALGPLYSSNPYEMEMANSAYNSLQVSLRHVSGPTTFLVGYTYSKCLDNSSGLQDTTNPLNYRVSRSLCNFDATHNFVASYSVHLPFDKIGGASSGWANKIASGWRVSGITTFATGLPLTLQENDDNSLIGTLVAPSDVPNIVPGKILNNTNPRSGQPYFNPALFRVESVGQLGNANRRFFHGPGLNNFDLALLKDTPIGESKTLEFRFETFNTFNHAQFNGPNGLINSSSIDPATGIPQGPSFGFVTSARDPRIMQVALKFQF